MFNEISFMFVNKMSPSSEFFKLDAGFQYRKQANAVWPIKRRRMLGNALIYFTEHDCRSNVKQREKRRTVS